MKVLIFSHEKDIDGLGCVVLGKMSFEKCDQILCDHYDIDSLMQVLIDTGDIYQYDKIFVTDICFGEPMLAKIATNNELREKTLVIDHHEFNVKKADNYDFVSVTVSNEKGLCSGTSLFYKYLVENGYLSSSEKLDEFAELTRRSDTWEWKKYNDTKADKLSKLLNATSKQKYIAMMLGKLNDSSENKFNFTENEEQLIFDYEMKMKNALEACENNLQIVLYQDMVVGVGTIDYNYRNDIAEYLREKNYPIDILLLLNLKDKSCSLRSISSEADVNEFAGLFGGGGSKKASGCPLTDDLIEALSVDLSLFTDEPDNN